MRGPWRTGATSIVVALPAVASGAPTPGAYGGNDAGGFLNILPPRQGQSVNGAEIAAFLGTGARPPTFGAEPGNVERTYSPP